MIESFDPGGVVDHFEKRDGRLGGCVVIEIRDTSAPIVISQFSLDCIVTAGLDRLYSWKERHGASCRAERAVLKRSTVTEEGYR